jgi:hypothetical protein
MEQVTSREEWEIGSIHEDVKSLLPKQIPGKLEQMRKRMLILL